MDFKKLLIIFSVIITIAIGVIFGVSYAWYAYSNAEVNVTGKSNKKAPTVIFSDTEYVYTNKIMPIYDEDRYNYGQKNAFNVTIDNSLESYEVGIEISLNDIRIANELKTTNYKYELLQDGKTVSEGNFSELTGASMNIMPMTVLATSTYPHTYTYELYVWLTEDDTDQNALMNKTFRAKINVKSAIKKK